MAEANDRADRKGPRSTKKTTSSTVVSDDAVTTAATAVADPPPKPTRKKRVPKVRRKGPKSAEQLAASSPYLSTSTKGKNKAASRKQ